MSNWDDLEASLVGVELGHEAGEWAVKAMACVAFADGKAEDSEIQKAREILSRASVIKKALDAEVGELLFLETIEKLTSSPEAELDLLKAELADLAGLIEGQEDRDQAFHTVVVIATADHEIQVSEYKLMQELKKIIGAEVMVPMPHLSV